MKKYVLMLLMLLVAGQMVEARGGSFGGGRSSFSSCRSSFSRPSASKPSIPVSKPSVSKPSVAKPSAPVAKPAPVSKAVVKAPVPVKPAPVAYKPLAGPDGAVVLVRKAAPPVQVVHTAPVHTSSGVFETWYHPMYFWLP